MLKTDHKSLLLAALLCSAAFLNQAARAADVSWNAATGDWTNAANWTPAQVPTAGDTASIDNSGNAQVTDVQSAEAYNLFVGDVSGGNSLGVSNGGTVTVGARVGIGNASTSSNNSVRLSDAGTFWTNGYDFNIGNDGSGNSFVISNGASAYLGRFTAVGNNAGSANNTLVVTDNAALTNFYDLYIGNAGFSNSLVVSGGGTLTVLGDPFAGHISGSVLGNAATSSNNSALVTGSGSTWRDLGLRVGLEGAGNSVLISNGAQVLIDWNSSLGENATSSNNSVVVTDNSLWTTAWDLYIGIAGSSNSLVISNGGMVAVAGANGYSSIQGSVLGYAATSSNNSVLVTGVGSSWSNNSLIVGWSGFDNSLVISNGAEVLVATSTLLGTASDSSNNSVVVTGAGSALNGSGDLHVGFNGSSNSLVISDGAQVADSTGWIGNTGTASNNAVVVTDAGTLWTNSAGLVVGNDGSDNSLTISNGAQVIAATVALIGNNSSSSNNMVVVTGADSVLSTPGDLYVGRLGSDNSLTISNGAQVANVTGVIGNDVSASNNAVVVTDAGSLWTNAGDLYVGNLGSGNSLTISNGAQVADSTGWIGNTGTASNNAVVVTDAGTLWTNSAGLVVGHDVSGNSLTVSNGAQVFASTIAIIGNNPSSSNNMVVVTGAGSALTTLGDLYVGNGGYSNSLVISDGGQVFDANGVIGNYAGASNSVLITGPGSLWSNSGTVNIGPNVGGASLALEDGAQLVAASSIYVQPAATLSGNGTITTTDLNVLGGGTLSPTGTNSLVINGDLKVGPWSFYNGQKGILLWNLDGNTNGPAGSTNFSAPITLNGALEVGYATFDINLGSNVSPSDAFWSNSATWTVINGTNPLTQAANFNMALSGNTNGFNIGAKFWEYSTNVNSFYLVTSGNSLQLLYSVGDFWTSGTDYWTNGGNWSRGLEPGSTTQPIIDNGGTAILETAGQAFNLFVGFTNSDNTLVVTNGGQLSVANFAYIGYGENSSNNSVVVTGPSSLLSSAGSDMAVGYLGSGNSLVVSDGAKVLGGSPDQYFSSYIGARSNSSGNSVLVTGANSLWSSSGDLYIGNEGSSNSLTVADGGTVANSYGYIGNYDTSSNNSVLVTGANSLWTNSEEIYVGQQGSDNSMVISNGGTVASGYGYIGLYGVSSNNSVLVTGTSSLWTNSQEIYVGLEGSDNSMVISNGGTVANSYGIIGYYNTSSNNSVLVTGTSSLWTNSSDLYVGYNGSGNSLVISNGGQVVGSGFGYVGYGRSSSNNSVTVSGTNSSLATTNGLFVGYGNGGNSLTITDGASVTVVGTSDSDYLSLGETGASSGNTLTVSGASTLSVNVATNSKYGIYIGDTAYSSNNTMVVSAGGKVYSGGESAIGYASGGLSNSALITGAGSLWTNNGVLDVGVAGQGILTVANGGTVAATTIRVAVDAGSTGVLNIGRLGANDAAGILDTPSIAFGAGTGSINFNQSNAMTLSAIISGNGGLNQLGSGTTELSGINTYTGPTSIQAGKLVVSGSIANSDAAVSGAGALGGTGTVGSLTILDGGTLSPGNSPGTLNVAGNMTWNADGNYNWQIHDTTLPAGTGWDLINATGTLDLSALTVGSEFNLNLWSLSGITPDADGEALNFDNTQNYTWTILTASSGITGFSADKFNINSGAANGTAGFANALAGGSFSMAQNGNNLDLIFTAAGGPAVPEPGTWATAALLVGGAAFLRWRKRAKVA